MKRLLALTALLLLSTLSHAANPLLIYKGTVKETAGPAGSSATPPMSSGYLIFDPTAGTVAFFKYYTFAKTKYYSPVAASAYNAISVSLSAGKTVTVLSQSFKSFANASNFGDILVYFRGTQSSLNVQTIPTVNLNQPHVFAGLSRLAGASGGNPGFVEDNSTYTFQSKQTIEANNAGKTTQNVLDDLATLYTNLGYQP